MMTISIAPVLTFALLSICLGMLLALLRLLRGPTAQDRVIALDMIYVSAMLLMLVQGMRYGNTLYFDIALLIALLGFIGSVAMAKFLLRGEVIE
ncbi:K+/H+ antiporter subunit F [Alcanivorax quisquiliarum]|uniref:K+/H+ antiporter subunit F n=1 Tax=Alcanivorax quisquiliarum TaxID=2933565 RepID=A0ABT0E889_9GAMM|nr:K+/H+ antiporter subunit F [Alcanivorax quisquiliarum]MCK0538057.1 K+/H+ antiporter subunit F [Alcanivorax quisquiliarum]